MHKQRNTRSSALDYKANQNFPLSHFSHYRPPISRLPVELLSEIFLYACTFRKGYHGNLFRDLSPFDKRAAPMNLSLTDSHWRQIAISIPIIWSNLKIYDMFPRHPSLLKLWLQRSRNAPLHIALDTRRYCWSLKRTDSCTCEVPCPLHEDPQTNEILSLLMEHSSRWETIKFNICMYRPTPLLSLDSADLSGLKSACLYDELAEAYGNNIDPEEIRSANNHLDVFWKHAAASPVFEGVTIYGGLPNHIHRNRLKYLSIEMPFFDLSVLKECAQLEHLNFSRPCSAIDPSNRIVMPNLKELELTAPSAGPGLNSFIFPSLESLSLCTPASRSTLQDLLEFIQRSRPPLSSLLLNSSCWWGEHSVHRDIQDPSALIELLSSSDLMASLRSLTMRGCPSPPHLIHLLSSPRSLPALENLCIGYPATIFMTDIMKMIALRNCGTLSVTPLRRFQAVAPDHNWIWPDPQKLHYESPDSGEVQYEGCTISIRTIHEAIYSNINVPYM